MNENTLSNASVYATSPTITLSLLRTERTRIWAVLLFLLAVWSYLVAQQLVFGIRGLPLTAMSLIIVGLLLINALLLRTVQSKIEQGIGLSPIYSIASVTTEIFAVGTFIVLATTVDYVGPYKALQTPINIAYAFFISTSVLRLNPWLCFLTGALAALSYLGLTGYTVWHYPDHDQWEKTFAIDYYITTAILLLLAGAIAAYIAYQFRIYLEKAVQEAELRQERDNMERDLRMAYTIQHELLPGEPPVVPNFEVAGCNIPAKYAGGDYYDWHELADNRLAISLADVTGHGIGVAMVTAACRAFGRATHETTTTIGQFLTRLNSWITPDLREGRFITFVGAILEPEANKMALASAGHGPILFYDSARNEVVEWEAQDIPLGVIDYVQYGDGHQIVFKRGECLLLVSDGLLEWRNKSGQPFGAERLKECIKTNITKDAETIVRSVLHDVEAFAAGAPQSDDVTIVAVKCTAVGH